MGRVTAVQAQRVCGTAPGWVEVFEGGIMLGRLRGTPEFQFELPAHCRDGAEHLLEFRRAEDGQALQGSPVRVCCCQESDRIPYHTSTWIGQRVLVLAPHPDDETFGCGGSLLHHRNHGDSLRVVVLTDGAQAGSAARRRQEASQACRLLGASVDFWGYPDRGLRPEPGLLKQLAELLQSYQPQLIYCPSPWEYHPDHRATCQALAVAARTCGLEATVLLYEIGHPLPVNTLVDIAGVREEKLRIGQGYASQLQLYPYAELMDGLNRYRSHTVSAQTTHCEGFFQLSLAELSVRELAAVPVAPILRERPQQPELVSLVVRTRQRPGFLGEALQSLAGQTYQNLEVLVVNDGEDDPRTQLQDFSQLLNLRWLTNPRRGNRSAAANCGLQQAQGRFLGLLDDDDLLYPPHLSKLAGFLQASGQSFAYSDCERSDYAWSGGRWRQSSRQSPFHSLDYDREELYFANYIPSMTPLFRRELLEAAGPLDENLGALEDWDLWLRMSAHANFFHLPGITAHYRVFGPRDYDFRELTLALYRKHSHFWTAERLADLGAVRQQNRRLQKELAGLRRPWWRRLLGR